MNIIFEATKQFFKLAWKYLKDESSYDRSAQKHIDKAIALYNDGDFHAALILMEALAEMIDCKNFHRFFLLQYKDINAREQYNMLCLYIAKIYSHEGNYDKVYKWSSHLAYVPHYDLQAWSDLLTESDLCDLKELMSDRDTRIDTVREVYEFENSKLVQ